jgi:hypothetical protein
VELIIMSLLVVLNGGYIYYLHRRLQRLAEANRAQAAADRRLVVTALEAGGELRSLTADMIKQAEIASRQNEQLNRFMLRIIKDHLFVDLSEGNGNGRRPKGQAARRPANGNSHYERPGGQPDYGLK